MAARNGSGPDVDEAEQFETSEDDPADRGEELDDEFDDELEPELDEADDDLDTFADEDDDDLGRVAAEEDADEDDETDPSPAALPPEAEFDDDGELISVVRTSNSDEDEIDGLRAGEFVCRSCYLAKRETQLADPKRLLCRDCA